MKKTIISIILAICLLSGVLALYSGESKTIPLDLDVYSNYTIEGNTSNINISVNNLIATISIPEDYDSGSFNITFNGYKSNQPKHIYENSGSGRSIIITKNITTEKVIYVNQSIPEKKNKNITITPKENKPITIYIWIAMAILTIILIIIMFKLIKKWKEE